MKKIEILEYSMDPKENYKKAKSLYIIYLIASLLFAMLAVKMKNVTTGVYIFIVLFIMATLDLYFAKSNQDLELEKRKQACQNARLINYATSFVYAQFLIYALIQLI